MLIVRPTRGPQQMSFKFSVVIVNWNSRDDLRACLQGLARQTDSGFETIVVDNGSYDDSVATVRAEFPGTIVVEAGENLGFAEGCNVGIAKASGTWIVTLNNDAEPDPLWIAKLREAIHSAGPELGMVQSKILFRQRPDRTNSTGVLIGPNGYFVDRAFDQPLRADEIVEEIFCASAGAAAYRRSMLDQIRLSTGYFDRTFFMYFEDVDLGWRARLSGWSAVYAPDAIVHHAFHGSSARRGKRFVSAHCDRNRLRALLKNASAPYILRALPRFVRDFAIALFYERTKAVSGFYRAARDGWSQRALVAQLAQCDRDAVERRWVVRPVA
jgi:GT2 family glycosyltransferase